MRVSLQNRELPRREDGYPNFTSLSDANKVFDEAELCELINRCIYQLEYQQTAHKKYQAAQREFEKPIKLAFKQLFPHQSWAKATPQQLEAALQAVAGRKEK